MSPRIASSERVLAMPKRSFSTRLGQSGTGAKFHARRALAGREHAQRKQDEMTGYPELLEWRGLDRLP